MTIDSLRPIDLAYMEGLVKSSVKQAVEDEVEKIIKEQVEEFESNLRSRTSEIVIKTVARIMERTDMFDRDLIVKVPLRID